MLCEIVHSLHLSYTSLINYTSLSYNLNGELLLEEKFRGLEWVGFRGGSRWGPERGPEGVQWGVQMEGSMFCTNL